MRELDVKFKGKLPHCEVDESAVMLGPARVPVNDVLTEDATSTCLTFCADSRTWVSCAERLIMLA